MNKIALALISGDNYNEQEVKKLLASVEGAVDHIYVAYNGKKGKLPWKKWTTTPVTYKKFEWEDDFAKARQQSFDMVPHDEFDWIMWMDTDDVLEFQYEESPLGMPNKRAILSYMFESLDPYTQGVYLRYDYAVDPNTGEVIIQQWRERIFSTELRVTWKFPIHEVAGTPPGTQFGKKEHMYVVHQIDPRQERGTRERNRRIIAKTLREHPDNPRMQYYLANEMMAEVTDLEGKERREVADAAVLAFRKFLSNDQSGGDDVYLAGCRIGEVYLLVRELNLAIDAFLQAIKIYPDWPDAYLGIARACMELEDWQRTKSFANLALKAPPPQTHSAVTPLTYQYTPLLLRGIAHEELGEYEEALQDYKAALDVWPAASEMIHDRIDNMDQKKAVTNRDRDTRKQLRGTYPDRSIAFVTAPIPEPWHPLLEKEGGAGGAETCIMRLAPRFRADGWRVVVFGTPGDYYGVDDDGIEWWNSNDFLASERFKVVVASRVPEIFEADINADQKYLWMHDVNVGPRMYPFRERPDKVIGLTDWHVNHMARLYGMEKDRFVKIPNGIELDLYDLSNRKDEGDLRFIWSSSPDRGLGTLVSMWPAIREAFPSSRLDVFYGWNIIDKMIAYGDRRAGYLLHMKREILGNIEMLGGQEAGIRQHGRVPQHELATHQLSAHVWAYPTDFMETSCITALEMQAAGVIPVTSDLAALTENVAVPELRISGWPLNRTYQQQFLERLFQTIESGPEVIEEYRQRGRALAERHTWDKSYAQWNELIGG